MSRTCRGRRILVCAVLSALAALAVPAAAQVPLDVYLGAAALEGVRTGSIREQVAALAKIPPGQRDEGLILNVLPPTAAAEFARLVAARGGLVSALAELDARRLNKMLANVPGTNGTSLLSKAVAPAVLAAAVEYGSILQQTSGTATTLRGNLLGMARLLFGDEQFPSCSIDGNCGRLTRTLRAVSGTVAFESIRTPTTTAPVAIGERVTAAQLLGDDYRVAAWGVRLDLSSKEDLQSPALAGKWLEVHQAMQNDPSVRIFSQAGLEVVQRFVQLPAYAEWRATTMRALQDAPDEAAMHRALERQLTRLLDAMSDSELEFGTALAALIRANAAFVEARNELLRTLHTNRASVEYTNRRPQDQPATSNVRLIYSHQPTSGPAIFTVNAAATMYDTKPVEADASRLRDVQLAGQVDRRLGRFGSLGDGILTLAAYYQWMKADAIVRLGPESAAPDIGIDLPEGAARVLGTKGHIGVAQLRFALSLSRVVRVPLSVTWATRRELIKASDVRGQIGLTLDLDQAVP